MEPKSKGLKQQQQQHKKLLAAMLSQDSFDSAQSTAPSVTEEDIDNEDDAMELLGNCKAFPVLPATSFSRNESSKGRSCAQVSFKLLLLSETQVSSCCVEALRVWLAASRSESSGDCVRKAAAASRCCAMPNAPGDLLHQAPAGSA